MQAEPFQASIQIDNQAARIDLAGEINAAAEVDLNAAYQEAERLLGSQQGLIVLNFKSVTYINSTGIALIVGLLARARKDHRTLGVVGLSDHYLEVFRITRLADFMQIFTDEAGI
jgi:anti-anti-sigma factor